MKTKIRFFINTLRGGGAEKVLIDLVSCLDPETYDVTIVSIVGGIHEKRIPPYIQYKKLVPCKSEFWSRVLYRLLVKLPPRLFAGWFLRGSYDLEVAYLEGTPTKVVAAKRKAKRIAFVHCNVAMYDHIGGFYARKEDCLREYRSFSRVCFVSEQGKQGFEQVIGPLDHACVVHNVLNIRELRQLELAEPALRYETEGWKLVSVGRLVKEKAFERLLQIMADLETDTPAELWIIGEGDERGQLEDFIREKQIKNVKLLGYQTNPYPYTKQADLFICSSLSEGYSTAVTEAIALGVPVLTTDCAGMNEILESGRFGMIVENHTEALREGLLRIMRDPNEYARLKKAVCDRSIGMTSEQAVTEYAELFRKVMEEAPEDKEQG